MTEEKKKIMVVDDEESIRDFLRVFLEDKGYRVTTYKNGQEAWLEISTKNLIEDKPFDLIITDLEMPEMNGIELIEKVRQEWLRGPLIILMTGRPDLVPENLPVDHITSKPFMLRDLAKTIKKLLSKMLKD